MGSRRLNGVRNLAIGVVIVAACLIFYPADLAAKLPAAGFVLALVLATSFIPEVGSRNRPSLKTTRNEAKGRAIAQLPAAASVDPKRPLLAVPRTGEALIHMIVVPGDLDEMPILIRPEFKWGRRYKVLAVADFAELRRWLQERDFGVLPQSEFSDELGVQLFGKDWRG